MNKDAYGLEISSTNALAREAFEQAVHGIAGHRPTTGAALGRAIAADADFVAAHALKGFANLILAREELVPVADAALGEAQRALAARDGGTADERILVEALEAACDNSFSRGIAILDAGFAARPHVFLPFKLAHALRFMIGDARGMLESSQRMLAHWRPDDRAAGFLLGCHAFALEEHGLYAEAERFGRRAVALEPEDAWGLHAVGHVFEMRGDTDGGIRWLENGRRNWSRCNNFSFHMAWHLALLHLERGDSDRVLTIYDEEVRPSQTDDFRDMANAVSLLWRLSRSGIDIADRWADLAEVARRRRTDTTLVFAALHNLMALVALGDLTAATDIIASLEAKAAETGDQAGVARDIGLPLARVIAGRGGWRDRQALGKLATSLPRVGGSNAQRDLFILALAEASWLWDDDVARGHILHVRHRLKAEDHLIAAVCRHATARRSPAHVAW